MGDPESSLSKTFASFFFLFLNPKLKTNLTVLFSIDFHFKFKFDLQSIKFLNFV